MFASGQLLLWKQLHHDVLLFFLSGCTFIWVCLFVRPMAYGRPGQWPVQTVEILGAKNVDFAPWKCFTFTGWEQTSLRHLRDHGNTFEDAACCRIGGKKNNIRFFLKGLCREESHFWWHNLAKHGNFSSKISLLNIYAKSVIISIIIILFQHSTW